MITLYSKRLHWADSKGPLRVYPNSPDREPGRDDWNAVTVLALTLNALLELDGGCIRREIEEVRTRSLDLVEEGFLEPYYPIPSLLPAAELIEHVRDLIPITPPEVSGTALLVGWGSVCVAGPEVFTEDASDRFSRIRGDSHEPRWEARGEICGQLREWASKACFAPGFDDDTVKIHINIGNDFWERGEVPWCAVDLWCSWLQHAPPRLAKYLQKELWKMAGAEMYRVLELRDLFENQHPEST